jgi:hypothetical protein
MLSQTMRTTFAFDLRVALRTPPRKRVQNIFSAFNIALPLPAMVKSFRPSGRRWITTN